MASNNENHVLNLYLLFYQFLKNCLPISKELKIDRFVHQLVTQQWVNISEQAKALNEGKLSIDLEKKIIDETIKKIQELKTIF